MKSKSTARATLSWSANAVSKTEEGRKSEREQRRQIGLPARIPIKSWDPCRLNGRSVRRAWPVTSEP